MLKINGKKVKVKINGKLCEHVRELYGAGPEVTRDYFVDSHNRKQGKFKEYWINKSNKNIANHCFYKDGLIDGRHVFCHITGEETAWYYLKKGILFGQQRNKYPQNDD